jgi:hypothetical protein
MSNAGGMSSSRAEKYAIATGVRAPVATSAMACSVYLLFVAAERAIELISEQEAAFMQKRLGTWRTASAASALISP